MVPSGIARDIRIFRFGVYEFDSGTGELRKNGLHVHLVAQSQEALRLLLQRAGQPVSREELQRVLWPDQHFGEHDHSLNNVVNRIREALRDHADNPRFIRTLPRIGYVFVAPVAEERASIPVPAEGAAVRHGAAAMTVAVILGALLLSTFARVVPRTAAALDGVMPAVPLTGAAGYESTPSFAPDGMQLAFSWSLNGARQIYRMSAGGGSPVALTSDAAQDSGPAWSPDGSSIAFVRQTSRQSADVYVVAASGGAPRKLTQVQRGHSEAPLTWTADSKALVWGDISSDGEPWKLSLIEAENGVVTELTAPVEFRGDAAPAVSPDGMRIAFARYTAASASDVFVADFLKRRVSHVQRLTRWQREVEAIVWTPDGQRLIFSGGVIARDTPVLYTVSADGSGEVSPLSAARIEGSYPAVSRAGALVFTHPIARRVAIWSLDLPGAGSGRGVLSRRVVSSAGDLHPDLSPDGQKLAFCSTRSGHPEIWTSNADGKRAARLVSLGDGGATCPRWSPDGTRIAFEGRVGGQTDIYVVDVANRAVLRVTTDPGNDFLPAWSSDSATIYFVCRRSGSPQIWAVPAAGGSGYQVTRAGGFHPMGAPQGRMLYHTGANGNPTLITRLSIDTGTEEDILTGFRGVWSFAPVQDGLFYLEQPPMSPRNAIRFLRFSDRTDTRVAEIPGAVHEGMSASRDGRHVVFPMEEAREANLMFVEHFYPVKRPPGS